MIQRFIELGQGYSDIYELFEIATSNQHRLSSLIAMHTEQVTSFVVILNPTIPGDFQPLYICREGIPNPHIKPNKRFDLFVDLSQKLNKSIIEMDVKPALVFSEKDLYFQHLIAILRLNHIIPPLR